jgi:hypothetical protein
MQDDLDRLIDSGLAAYSSAEPLAGLEQRVLRRVRLVRRRRWWGLMLVPAAAALVFALMPAKRLEIAVTPPRRPTVETLTQPIHTATVKPLPRPRRPRPVASNPKREFFPTLTPLTTEERVLVQVARATPQQLLPPPAKELEIKPIEIAPLIPDGRQ